MSGIVIDWLGGNCPVQAEGTIDGKPFYFRSRGAFWSLDIGDGDIIVNPEWHHEEPYGTWPDAGWITEDEARAFIQKGADLWRSASLLQKEKRRKALSDLAALDGGTL